MAYITEGGFVLSTLPGDFCISDDEICLANYHQNDEDEPCCLPEESGNTEAVCPNPEKDACPLQTHSELASKIMKSSGGPLSWESFITEFARHLPITDHQRFRESFCKSAHPGFLISRDFISLDTPWNTGLLKLQLVVLANERSYGGKFSRACHYCTVLATKEERKQFGTNQTTLTNSFSCLSNIFTLADDRSTVGLKPEPADLHRSFFLYENNCKVSAVYKLRYFLFLCHGSTVFNSAFEFACNLLKKEERTFLTECRKEGFRKVLEKLPDAFHVGEDCVSLAELPRSSHEDIAVSTNLANCSGAKSKADTQEGADVAEKLATTVTLPTEEQSNTTVPPCVNSPSESSSVAGVDLTGKTAAKGINPDVKRSRKRSRKRFRKPSSAMTNEAANDVTSSTTPNLETAITESTASKTTKEGADLSGAVTVNSSSTDPKTTSSTADTSKTATGTGFVPGPLDSSTSSTEQSSAVSSTSVSSDEGISSTSMDTKASGKPNKPSSLTICNETSVQAESTKPVESPETPNSVEEPPVESDEKRRYSESPRDFVTSVGGTSIKWQLPTFIRAVPVIEDSGTSSSDSSSKVESKKKKKQVMKPADSGDDVDLPATKEKGVRGPIGGSVGMKEMGKAGKSGEKKTNAHNSSSDSSSKVESKKKKKQGMKLADSGNEVDCPAVEEKGPIEGSVKLNKISKAGKSGGKETDAHNGPSSSLSSSLSSSRSSLSEVKVGLKKKTKQEMKSADPGDEVNLPAVKTKPASVRLHGKKNGMSRGSKSGGKKTNAQSNPLSSLSSSLSSSVSSLSEAISSTQHGAGGKMPRKEKEHPSAIKKNDRTSGAMFQFISDDATLAQTIASIQKSEPPVVSLSCSDSCITVLHVSSSGFIVPIPKTGFSGSKAECSSTTWSSLWSFLQNPDVVVVIFDCETTGRFLLERLDLQLFTVFDVKTAAQVLSSCVPEFRLPCSTVTELTDFLGLPGFRDQLIVGETKIWENGEYVWLREDKIMATVYEAKLLVPGIYSSLIERVTSLNVSDELQAQTTRKLQSLYMGGMDTIIQSQLAKHAELNPVSSSEDSNSISQSGSAESLQRYHVPPDGLREATLPPVPGGVVPNFNTPRSRADEAKTGQSVGGDLFPVHHATTDNLHGIPASLLSWADTSANPPYSGSCPERPRRDLPDGRTVAARGLSFASEDLNSLATMPEWNSRGASQISSLASNLDSQFAPSDFRRNHCDDDGRASSCDNWFNCDSTVPSGNSTGDSNPSMADKKEDILTLCQVHDGNIIRVPLEEAFAYESNLSGITEELQQEYSTQNRESIKQLLNILGEDITSVLGCYLQGGKQCIESLTEITLDVGRHAEARFHRTCKDEKPTVVVASSKTITSEDLKRIQNDKSLTGFDDDNRCGIEATLHSIRGLRNKKRKLVGLTVRIGLPMPGCADMMYDIAQSGKSALILGYPGVGKTTLLRELARSLSDHERRRVVVIDTYNEIAGDDDVPHPSIGSSRRLQVDSLELQPAILLESAKNHGPEVIIVDQIDSRDDVRAVARLSKSGIQVIAGTNRGSIESLVTDDSLSELFQHRLTGSLNDSSSIDSAGGLAKSKLSAVFGAAVEMKGTDCWHVHDLALTYSNLTDGLSYSVQERRRVSSDVPSSKSQILLREKVIQA